MSQPDEVLPWIFPFFLEREAKDHPLGRNVLRPVVEVRLLGREEGQKVAALVDSGSEHTLASRWMAQEIGVTPDPDREMTIQIGGAPRQVRFADVTIRLCPPRRPGYLLGHAGEAQEDDCIRSSGLEWQAETGFLMNWEAPPWPMILGQVGFFDQFTVTFNRYAQAIALEDVGVFDERFPFSGGSATENRVAIQALIDQTLQRFIPEQSLGMLH